MQELQNMLYNSKYSKGDWKIFGEHKHNLSIDSGLLLFLYLYICVTYLSTQLAKTELLGIYLMIYWFCFIHTEGV